MHSFFTFIDVYASSASTPESRITIAFICTISINTFRIQITFIQFGVVAMINGVTRPAITSESFMTFTLISAKYIMTKCMFFVTSIIPSLTFVYINTSSGLFELLSIFYVIIKTFSWITNIMGISYSLYDDS